MPTFRRQTFGKFGIMFHGLDELMRRLRPGGEVWDRVQKAVIQAMIENTEDLLGRSMRDAPVREGPLRASGSAVVFANGRPVARRGTQAFNIETGGAIAGGRIGEMSERGVEVGYRIQERRAIHAGGLGDAVVGIVGFNMPYALVQHERLDFHHPKGGKAKYLEANLKAQAEAYESNLRDRVAGALA